MSLLLCSSNSPPAEAVVVEAVEAVEVADAASFGEAAPAVVAVAPPVPVELPGSCGT